MSVVARQGFVTTEMETRPKTLKGLPGGGGGNVGVPEHAPQTFHHQSLKGSFASNGDSLSLHHDFLGEIKCRDHGNNLRRNRIPVNDWN
jgi:hypothetical protein